MSSTIVIDPDGDIFLQLVQEHPPEEIRKPDEDAKKPDEEAKDIKEETTNKEYDTKELVVSSKVLSLASPVLKAMLSDKFKEGRELAERKAESQPYILTLHGDDIEAVVLLCKILHFKMNLPETPTPEYLEKLAFLCDKYECIEAMRYCGSVWIRDWLLAHDNKSPHID